MFSRWLLTQILQKITKALAEAADAIRKTVISRMRKLMTGASVSPARGPNAVGDQPREGQGLGSQATQDGCYVEYSGNVLVLA